MRYLAATLHTLGVQLQQNARRRLSTDREAGSVTIEQVLWAVALIAIVAIVVGAITAYVRDKAALIK